MADPALNLKGFFPILLDSFGTWDKKLYGIPFDNYAGLLFYNRCMLEKAGFKSSPSVPDSFNMNSRKCVQQQLYEPIKYLLGLRERSSQQRQPQPEPSPYQPLLLVTPNRALTSNQHAPDVHDHQQANQPIQPVMKHHVRVLVTLTMHLTGRVASQRKPLLFKNRNMHSIRNRSLYARKIWLHR